MSTPRGADGRGDIQRVAAELRRRVGGEVREGEPLARHTTLKVGGPAAVVVVAETGADLAAVAHVCADTQVPWLILGRGSNLLVCDRGWRGVVVALGRGFRGVEVGPPDVASLPFGGAVAVLAGAAERMPILARTLARQQIGGLAFGVAIPGSLGGAVRMNAGAHGSALRDVLDWADVVRLGQGGRTERLAAEQLDMGYRRTALPADAVVVRARLTLQRAAHDELAVAMGEMRRWRREHQPINEPSCGSVFRNPPGDSAGRLVEAAGMKGHRVGAAQVSPRHANFITVDKGGSAADVVAVIADVRAAVAERHGVALRTEVVLAGFDSETMARTGAS